MNNRDTWLTSKGKISLSGRVLIMGVLNLTPDSFSDGGKFTSVDAALDRALEMVNQGADIIDVGAESTRPDADPIPAEIELSRINPVLEGMGDDFPVPISVDTYKADVADVALNLGAEIVNDISGLKRDSEMAGVVARHKAGLVIMHMRGNSKTMQSLTNYRNLVADVRAELEESAQIALGKGIELERIVFDPGIGFAKDYLQSCILINRLAELSIMERPILVGVSRKSYIGKILNLPVEERLEGTIAASVLSMVRGASILRVHDVKEVKRAVEVAKVIMEESHKPT
ncbi:MAG: dihydropteroate synthase [Candidatus Glassbacteria bacterium]